MRPGRRDRAYSAARALTSVGGGIAPVFAIWQRGGYPLAMSEEITSMRCPVAARDRLNERARELGISTAELLRILQHVTVGEIVIMSRRRGRSEAADGDMEGAGVG